MTLRSCSSCSGFLPPSALRCPHCGEDAVAPRGRGPDGLVRGLVAVAVGGVAAVTLMACYGSPCATGGACVGTGATTGQGGAGGSTAGTGGATVGNGGAGGSTAANGGAGGSTAGAGGAGGSTGSAGGGDAG